MRRRCREKLDEGLDPSYWRGVLRGLEAAPISTFHGFCAWLLQKFAIEAGQDPGFGVVDPVVAPSMRDAAIGRAVRAWLTRPDPDFTALAVDYGVMGTRDLIAEIVEDRSRVDLEKVSQTDPAESVQNWENILREQDGPAMLKEIVTKSGSLLGLLRATTCAAPKMKARREFLLEHLPGLADRADGLEWLPELRENATIVGATAKYWSDSAAYEPIRDGLKDLREWIDELRKIVAYDRPTSLAAAATAQRLARLTLEAITNYEQDKQERGEVDFDDLQLLALTLLKTPPEPVGAWLAGTIAHVLVDEFQDTDPVQSEIIKQIAGEGWKSGRLFLVGDTKQSIYRFRGAQPGIFDDWRDQLPADTGQKQLTANFRSVPEILDFVNALFAEAFPGREHVLVPGLDELGTLTKPVPDLALPLDQGGSQSCPALPLAKGEWEGVLPGCAANTGTPLDPPLVRGEAGQADSGWCDHPATSKDENRRAVEFLWASEPAEDGSKTSAEPAPQDRGALAGALPQAADQRRLDDPGKRAGGRVTPGDGGRHRVALPRDDGHGRV